MLTIVAVTSSAFVATNLDNLILLVALFSRYQQRPLHVAFGYFAGMLIILAVSMVIGKASEMIPVAYLGFLGIIPVLIGVTALVRLFRGVGSDSGSGELKVEGSFAVFAATLVTQLSNGADTVVTFSILFADSLDAADYWMGLAFILMLCVFASTAYYSRRHPWLSGLLKRYGHYVTPFILITIGLFVLSNTAMDVIPG